MFRHQIATVLFLLTDVYFKASVESKGPVCPLGWFSTPPFTYCLLISEDSLNFDQASDRCLAQSANLTTLSSVDELKLIANLLVTISGKCSDLENCVQFLIGLRYGNFLIAGSANWTWVDGTPVSKTTSIKTMLPRVWSTNTACVAISARNGGSVLTTDCGQASRYICKKALV